MTQSSNYNPRRSLRSVCVASVRHPGEHGSDTDRRTSKGILCAHLSWSDGSCTHIPVQNKQINPPNGFIIRWFMIRTGSIIWAVGPRTRRLDRRHCVIIYRELSSRALRYNRSSISVNTGTRMNECSFEMMNGNAFYTTFFGVEFRIGMRSWRYGFWNCGRSITANLASLAVNDGESNKSQCS